MAAMQGDWAYGGYAPSGKLDELARHYFNMADAMIKASRGES